MLGIWEHFQRFQHFPRAPLSFTSILGTLHLCLLQTSGKAQHLACSDFAPPCGANETWERRWLGRPLQAGRSIGETFRQGFLARVVPPGVPPQSPGFGSLAMCCRGSVPSHSLGKRPWVALLPRKQKQRDLASVADSLSLPRLLPGGIRALMPNELNDFPSLSWECKKGGSERLRANATNTPLEQCPRGSARALSLHLPTASGGQSCYCSQSCLT